MNPSPSLSQVLHASLETGAAWLLAPLTLDNFPEALSQAPFPRYVLNTFVLVSTILVAQRVLSTLAAFALVPVHLRLTPPLTVGLGIFGAPESGVNWSVISAATLLTVAPLLIAFLLFQRQFVQSFMYAGIK